MKKGVQEDALTNNSPFLQQHVAVGIVERARNQVSVSAIAGGSLPGISTALNVQ
ncbi:MAG: hypothetical protein QNK37_12175 [Acidobacteriota bacterium]|nr:hypothetical protein [Acidobacteriota bacterium]